MVHTDARFSQAVHDAVAAIESLTDAELVVVAAPRSGSYRDVALTGGLAAAVAALAFLCWSPWVFNAMHFPVDVALAGVGVAWALERWGGLLRPFVPAARRRRQVREAALAAFAEEAVHATEGRTGLLVYVSAFEERVEVVPDQGLLARIPGHEWNALDLRADTLDHLLSGLEAVGKLLAARFPPTGANPDEISNTPRVRE